MSEPDYMVESMPYYASNPVYMPRQREFHHRVYFDRVRRQQNLTLGQLVGIADSLTCATGRIALLGITYPEVFAKTAGDISLAYYPSRFFWDSAGKARLFARGQQIAHFETPIGDENYRVFEIAPRTDSGCTTRHAPQ
jgi:hypothetical protein